MHTIDECSEKVERQSSTASHRVTHGNHVKVCIRVYLEAHFWSVSDAINDLIGGWFVDSYVTLFVIAFGLMVNFGICEKGHKSIYKYVILSVNKKLLNWLGFSMCSMSMSMFMFLVEEKF